MPWICFVFLHHWKTMCEFTVDKQQLPSVCSQCHGTYLSDLHIHFVISQTFHNGIVFCIFDNRIPMDTWFFSKLSFRTFIGPGYLPWSIHLRCWLMPVYLYLAACVQGPDRWYKQRVLMHRHQGWNVRHGLCHIYMRYIYICVVYSFCLFCCLFIIVTWWYIWCIVWQVASKRKYRHVW